MTHSAHARRAIPSLYTLCARMATGQYNWDRVGPFYYSAHDTAPRLYLLTRGPFEGPRIGEYELLYMTESCFHNLNVDYYLGLNYGEFDGLRNEITHGRWDIARQLLRAILWIHHRDLAEAMGVHEPFEDMPRSNPQAPPQPRLRLRNPHGTPALPTDESRESAAGAAGSDPGRPLEPARDLHDLP